MWSCRERPCKTCGNWKVRAELLREAAQPDGAGCQLGQKLFKLLDSDCLGLRELQKSVFPFFAIYSEG